MVAVPRRLCPVAQPAPNRDATTTNPIFSSVELISGRLFAARQEIKQATCAAICDFRVCGSAPGPSPEFAPTPAVSPAARWTAPAPVARDAASLAWEAPFPVLFRPEFPSEK